MVVVHFNTVLSTAILLIISLSLFLFIIRVLWCRDVVKKKNGGGGGGGQYLDTTLCSLSLSLTTHYFPSFQHFSRLFSSSFSSSSLSPWTDCQRKDNNNNILSVCVSEEEEEKCCNTTQQL